MSTTYDTEMKSTQQKTLPELFELRTASGNTYVTDYERELSFNANVYSPVSIKRSNFSFDNKLGVVSCTVSAAILDQFAKYIAFYPTDRARMLIYRAIEEDMTQYSLIFDGYIQSVGFKDGVATVKLEEKSTILSAELNMFVFQASCNHHIFDSNCRLDYINWVINAQVLALSDNTLTTDAILGYPVDYFVGGEVHFLGDARLIVAQDAGVLTLHVPFDSRVAVGTTVEVFPNGGGDPEKCTNTFSNFDNFLGCPYIPNKNPSVWGV